MDWNYVAEELIANALGGILTALVTALIGTIIAKKYLSQLNFNRQMQAIGIINTSTRMQTRREIARMCEKAELIRLMNVSGVNYLKDNEKLLKSAMDRGASVQLLCCAPDSIFLTDIEEMEHNQKDPSGKPLRSEENHISDEIIAAYERYADEEKMEIRFYNTQYRMPYVLVYQNDDQIRAWLTVTLPPYKARSKKSFVLRGEKSGTKTYNDEINFIDMIETNFENIWEHGSVSAKEYMDRRQTAGGEK